LEDVGINKDNINMDLTAIVLGGMDSSGSGQGPMVGYHEHSNELSSSIKGGECLG
jgi:hypothetical protein